MSIHQLKMSPTADWPASIAWYPGTIEPGTMPQMPGMSGTLPRDGTRAQSQVEVPMTLTRVPTRMPQPIEP